MNYISWFLFGTLAGLAAALFDTEKVKGGLFGSVILGVCGAFVGGVLANLLFGAAVVKFDLPSFLIAVTGSLLLLFVYRAVFISPESKF